MARKRKGYGMKGLHPLPTAYLDTDYYNPEDIANMEINGQVTLDETEQLYLLKWEQVKFIDTFIITYNGEKFLRTEVAMNNGRHIKIYFK